MLSGCYTEPEFHNAIADNRGPFQAGPVAVPKDGALLGAWVRPESYSQTGRTEAVVRFQNLIGRELDIVHSYRRLHEEIGTESDHTFGQKATLMISWAGGASADIVAGKLDDRIRTHARQVRALGKPILLRMRWEMDRPNLAGSVGSPEDYQRAWRHVRKAFEREGATNVAWVFCPTAEGFEENRAAAYYPGDDAVDWTCADVYAGSRLRSMSQLLQPFLRWAAQRPKPIVIGEYGVARGWSGLERRDWLDGATDVFRDNRQIKAVLYFESNPDERTELGEFALSDDPAALAAFRRLAQDAYFNP